jgi:hypothetical protein
MMTTALTCADWVAGAGEVPCSGPDVGDGVVGEGDVGDGDVGDGDVGDGDVGCIVGDDVDGVAVGLGFGLAFAFGVQVAAGAGEVPFLPLGPDAGCGCVPPPFTFELCPPPPLPLAVWPPDEKTFSPDCEITLSRPDRAKPPTTATRTTAAMAMAGRTQA